MLAKKSLGQHWLYDEGTLKVMLKAGEVSKNDTVLEVGPGLGSLTELLSKQAKQVIAVEKDRELASRLRKEAVRTQNLQIIIGDILEFDFTELPQGYKVVANIPYYLTSNLLRQLLEANNPPSLMALMLQKEVAERIVAQPGKMSLLAFSVQYYAQAQLVGVVPKELFQPPPQVDSAILQIKRRATPAFAADTKLLFRLVKAGFAGKRKQLKNSLAAGLRISSSTCSQILKKASIDPRLRAQDLSLDDWNTIYHTFLNLLESRIR